jgi:predicted aspartyl protease
MQRVSPRSNKAAGRVIVDLEVANYVDMAMARRGLLPTDQVRRQTIKGEVDSGATRLVLPAALVKELGLPLRESVRERRADGRIRKRPQAEGVHLELLGRRGSFAAIVESDGENAVIGRIVLADLDLLVDLQHQRVIPRDPQGPIYEIE